MLWCFGGKKSAATKALKHEKTQKKIGGIWCFSVLVAKKPATKAQKHKEQQVIHLCLIDKNHKPIYI